MAKQNSVMEAGIRIPDFVLTDQWGEVFNYYASITGGSVVFVVLARDDEENKPLLRALEEKLPEFKAQNANLCVICKDTLEQQTALSQELDLHYPVLADPGGEITDWFLSSAQALAPVVFVLDPNQRLISLKQGAIGNASALPKFALQEVTKIAPKGEPRIFSEVAPVLFIPNVFNRDYCQHLIELWKTGGHTDGLIVKGEGEDPQQKVDYGNKRRKDHTILDSEQLGKITNMLGQRMGPELLKNYYINGWNFEPFKIGCYTDTDAGFFMAHRDNISLNVKGRRFAISINLNVEDYEGGDLRFPEYGIDLYRPPTGGAIVFSCSLLHEVLPVSKGRRFVFLTFLSDLRY